MRQTVVQTSHHSGEHHMRNGIPSQPMLLFFVVFSMAVPAQAQVRLHGTVVDISGETPISGAQVQVYSAGWYHIATRITDDAGTFTAELPRRGSYRLRVRRTGYKSVDTPLLQTGASALLGVKVHMDPDAIPLHPLTVVARASGTERHGRLRDFHYRMETGLGHFFTRSEIEELAPHQVSDLIARVPGVRLESAGNGTRRVIQMARAARADGRCPVQIFLDGLLVNRRFAGSGVFIDDLVQPASVEALEIYKGLGSIPASFLGPDSKCGVVAVWTRRGNVP